MKRSLVEVAGVSKQKEVQMGRLWKGKGVPMFIGAVTGVLIVLMLMSAGIARAGFRVENRADLMYYTSIQQKIAYTGFDTAMIVVLYGPKMTIEKWAKNDVTGESTTSDTMSTHVSRGETLSFHLYSQNDLPGDTDAWYVTITDTFSVLNGVPAGSPTATVGSDTITKSFTFVTGSASCDSVSALYMQPDDLSYSESAATWTAWESYTTGVVTMNLKTTITGIRWRWKHIASKTVWDDVTNSNILSGRPYLIHVWYSILRNDN